jgi:polyhydroxyalkanoate synthase subunit PhaE
MTEKRDTEKPSMEWANILFGLFNPMMNDWGEMFKTGGQHQAPEFKGRMGEAFQSTTKMWKAMADTMSGPEMLNSFQKATQVTPDIALEFAQSCMNGFVGFQGHVREWLKKRADINDPIDAQAMDKEFIRQWTEAYEDEFSQYFKVPQIGLGRVYQERAMQAADKLNVFQTALTDFLHQLYIPMEKSFKSLQEKMAEMTQADEPLDEKSKTYYNLWIRLLEGHYMELFKKPEFIDSLTRTLGSLEEYSSARHAVVNDILKMYAIPSHKDLDELYKEIYLLKKRMREYEKKK